MTHPDSQIPDPDYQPEFYADIPMKRLFAWVIDTVLVTIFCVLILPFTAFTGLFFFPFLMLVVGFLYRIITLSSRSATWGMRLVAIEFRTLSGEKFDGSMAFWHTLGLTVSFAMFPLQFISIIMMLTGRRAQGLSDTLLGTVAINQRAAS